MASGESAGQAALGGLESGGLAFAGGEALGALTGGSVGFSDLATALGESGATAPALFGGGTSSLTPALWGGGGESEFAAGETGSGLGIGTPAGGTSLGAAAVGSTAGTTSGITPTAPTPGPATPAIAPGTSGGTGAGALAGPSSTGGISGPATPIPSPSGTPTTPVATTLGGASPAAATGTNAVDNSLFDYGGGDVTTGQSWLGPAPLSLGTPNLSTGGLSGLFSTGVGTDFPTTSGSGLTNIGSTVGNWLAANPGVLIGGGLLGIEGLMNSGNPPGLGPVTSQARNLTGLGNQALSAEQSGNIPGGYEAALNEAQSSAEAQIRSQYAALGLSGSTMESQALAQVPQQIAAEKANIISTLAQQGLSEMGMADTLDLASMQAQMQQQQELENAIASFAASLAGGSVAKALA